MSQTQVLGARIRLPSGKDAGLVDILSFFYGLSETDVQVLMALMRGDVRRIEDLETELKLSKASISNSLNALHNSDLVMRVKETNNKVGRPRYIYKAREYTELKSKVLNDIRSCSDKILELVDQHLRGS